MAFVQIRGNQIMDGQIGNHHIDPNAPIQESNLVINWHSHTEALEDRKIIIPVQVNNVTLGAGASMDVTSYLTGNVYSTSVGTQEGIVSDAPNNKVAIRDLSENIVYVTDDGAEYELYGRITVDNSATPVVTLSYFYNKNGVETAHTFVQEATPVNYVLFVPKRQNLLTMDEMVLAGYRFMVQDAVDAVTGANTHQLAVDLYGPNYKLTGNGVAKLSRSVIAEIQYQTSGVVNTSVRANSIIDEVIDARGSFQDLTGRFANIENDVSDAKAAIVANKADADAVKAEVQAARTNAASTPVTYSSLKARLDAIDGSITGLTNGGSSTQTEVDAARVTTVAQQSGVYYTAADLAARLSADFSSVLDKLSAEQTRAVAAEGQIASDLAAEVTRAKAAEKANSDAIAAEVTRATGVEGQLTSDLAAEVTRAEAAEAAIKSDLSNSTDATKGAALVGVKSTKVSASNVLAALDELKDGIVAAQNAAAAANTAMDGRVTDLETEVHNARGSLGSVDARLDVAINEDGTLKAGKQIHDHKKFVYQAVGGENSVTLGNGAKFQVGDESLDVYVNGTLQSKGLHYTENADGTGVSFGSTALVAGDVIVLKYIVNNAQ